MYSRIRKSDSNESMIKSMGPYRSHSSGSSIASVQSSGTFGPSGTFTIAAPLPVRASEPRGETPQPPKDDDIRMLMQRHKKTLELLAE